MNDKTNDIIYTAIDIEKYLSGKLSPLQMHAMEKAALDDPFLAEAMEGYAGMKEEQWKDQLGALKNRFENNGIEAKVIAMPRRKNNWWKAVAAVLLIGTTAAVSYLLLNKKDTTEIATTTPAVKSAPLVDTVILYPPMGATATVTPELPTTPKKNTTYLSADENTAAAGETKAADSAFVYTPGRQKAKIEAKQNAEIVKSDAEDVTISGYTKPATVVAPPVTFSNINTERKAEGNKYYWNSATNGVTYQAEYDKFAKAKTVTEKDGLAALKKEAQLNHNFRAQVVGADNSPLPFANISIKSENFGTYADAKGNFGLVSSDSMITVEVKAAGYQPRFYTLQSYNQQNKIMLAQEDVALKYKAVSGNSTAKGRTSRRATLIKDSLVNVEPADGWDNYNTYVDNNIEIPDDIVDKNIHGRVELSFDVKSNGTITNIKVDKSLCDNCDELAKRLIEQGPQWKVKKGKKGKGKVSVEF
jgi:hypothetical protein